MLTAHRLLITERFTVQLYFVTILNSLARLSLPTSSGSETAADFWILFFVVCYYSEY